jgi:hypothetical protein
MFLYLKIQNRLMSDIVVKEQPPLAIEEKPFHKMQIFKVENVTKGRYIGAMVTHHPESMEGIAQLAKDNKVKTIILEDSPGLMDVLQGRKTIESNIKDVFKVDLERNPEAVNIPRIASYKRRCEILLELKEQDPELKVIVIDPYYDKQAVGPKGETYADRMSLNEGIDENMKRVTTAIEIKDFEGAVENMKAVAKDTAKQIEISEEMRATAIAKENYRGNVLIESGEGHVRLSSNLEANVKDRSISVVSANKEIIEKVFKEDKNIYPQLLQLAHQYIEKGEAVEKDVADLLAARACAAVAIFTQELSKLLKEKKTMSAEKDYQIIKAANELSLEDSKKIVLG